MLNLLTFNSCIRPMRHMSRASLWVPILAGSPPSSAPSSLSAGMWTWVREFSPYIVSSDMMLVKARFGEDRIRHVGTTCLSYEKLDIWLWRREGGRGARSRPARGQISERSSHWECKGGIHSYSSSSSASQVESFVLDPRMDRSASHVEGAAALLSHAGCCLKRKSRLGKE
jgi:hypothetical protein